LCTFLNKQGEFKNTIKAFYQQFDGKKQFPVILFPSIFVIAFLAVSLHEELPPKKQISKIAPKNR
jgi:hypothetical protein